MKILILGAGKMGSFFVDLLSFDHETAVYEVNAAKLRFMYNTQRFTSLEEVEAFKPELVINAVTLDHTIEVFETVTPYLRQMRVPLRLYSPDVRTYVCQFGTTQQRECHHYQ